MTQNILTKSNISKFAHYILKNINSNKDFESAYTMTLIFVEYNKLNGLELQYRHNLNEDELAERFFTLSIYSMRLAEKILNSNLHLC